MSHTVAILYGWAEGEWQSRQFSRELSLRGFQLGRDCKTADIIFAHSAGCYEVPKDVCAGLVLLVGLPYWPQRRLASGVLRKLIRELTYHRRNKGLKWWLIKALHNSWYILIKPKASYDLITKQKLANLPAADIRKVVLVRPSDDTLMHPDIASLIGYKHYDFVTMPGAHDDCWIEPEPYVELLQRLLDPNSRPIKSPQR